MKTSVERVDATTVRLAISVPAARVDAAIDHAAEHLAGQVKVPGFRPGRVPRRVLETRVGRGTLLSEAAREFLPTFYSEAVQAESLEPVGPPEFDVDTFEGGTDAAFTATVEVRPTFDLPAWEGIEVAHPEWEVTDHDISKQLDALRERFAELETVPRPIQEGDFATITVSATAGGKRVEEASAEDVLYEVGEATQTDRALDTALLGASAGAIVTFTDTLGEDYDEGLAGTECDFRVIVKEVKRKQLPELDDDFALTASEFDTADELRADLRANLARSKQAYARQALRGRVVEEVTALAEVPLPSSMVATEQRFRLDRMAQQAEQYGLPLEAYLAAIGSGPEQVGEQIRTEAERTVTAQLVVDAIGRAAEINVTEADVGEEIARQAVRLGREAEDLARFMTADRERIAALVTDAFRRKTIDLLVAGVTVTGAPPADEAAEELVPDEDDVEGRSAAAVLDDAEAAEDAEP